MNPADEPTRETSFPAQRLPVPNVPAAGTASHKPAPKAVHPQEIESIKQVLDNMALRLPEPAPLTRTYADFSWSSSHRDANRRLQAPLHLPAPHVSGTTPPGLVPRKDIVIPTP